MLTNQHAVPWPEREGDVDGEGGPVVLVGARREELSVSESCCNFRLDLAASRGVRASWSQAVRQSGSQGFKESKSRGVEALKTFRVRSPTSYFIDKLFADCKRGRKSGWVESLIRRFVRRLF